MVEHNFHLNFLVIFTCFVSVLLDQIMLIWVQFNRFLPPAAVVDPGKGPSLILDQTKGPKANNFFGDPPPPSPYLKGLDVRPPYLKVWIRHCAVRCCQPFLNTQWWGQKWFKGGHLKGHSQLWDRAGLDTTFASLKSVYLNPKSNLRVQYI